MNANPGDLVVCVDAEGVGQCTPLSKGRTYRVTLAAAVHGVRAYGLEGMAGPSGKPTAYLAARFRRLNDEPDNAELIERIKSCKPEKVSA